jgi:hypothetical protein
MTGEKILIAEARTDSKTEIKVKAASYATFAVSLVVLAFLGTTATDFIHAAWAPDWAEVPLYSLLGTLVTFVSGYYTRSKPDALSESTIIAAQKWLRDRMPRP